MEDIAKADGCRVWFISKILTFEYKTEKYSHNDSDVLFGPCYPVFMRQRTLSKLENFKKKTL